MKRVSASPPGNPASVPPSCDGSQRWPLRLCMPLAPTVSWAYAGSQQCKHEHTLPAPASKHHQALLAPGRKHEQTLLARPPRGCPQVCGIPTAFPAELVGPEEDLLQVVYDHRPVAVQASPACAQPARLRKLASACTGRGCRLRGSPRPGRRRRQGTCGVRALLRCHALRLCCGALGPVAALHQGRAAACPCCRRPRCSGRALTRCGSGWSASGRPCRPQQTWWLPSCWPSGWLLRSAWGCSGDNGVAQPSCGALVEPARRRVASLTARLCPLAYVSVT